MMNSFNLRQQLVFQQSIKCAAILQDREDLFVQERATSLENLQDEIRIDSRELHSTTSFETLILLLSEHQQGAPSRVITFVIDPP